VKAESPEALPGARKVARVLRVVLATLGTCIFVAGALAMYFGWMTRMAARERTELPLKLQAGAVAQADFKTAGRCALVVELALSRHEGVPDDAIDEFIFATNGMQIDWSVEQGGRTIFSGNPPGPRLWSSGASDHRSKAIGQFSPRAGTYQFIARTRSDWAGLERARPRLVIKPNPVFMKNAIVGGSLRIQVGFVAMLGGLILMLLAKRAT
jgi:hypothetical protein